ncbi:MAG: GntR family transcriptional regulator [Rhizobium sp.]|nr:GntR family transcriptional regulator [Rhizobium sp.]
MTVYRRPDPIPRRRPEPSVQPSPLQSVRPESDDLHHLVARKIYAAIAGGHFPEGSILPNEHALGETLGVSRTALREAIKGLSSKGMLETRRRRGTMVLDRCHWTQVDGEVINWSRRADSSVSGELWQALQSVMPTLAEAAARNGSALRLAMPPTGIGEGRVLAITLFFTDIARLAENRFLFSVASIGLINLIQDDPDFLRRGFDGMADVDLMALHGAVVSGDAVAAANGMRVLFDKAFAGQELRSRQQLPA